MLLSEECADFGADRGNLCEPDKFSRQFYSYLVSTTLSVTGLARAADSDAIDAAALKEIRSEMRQLREERKRDREVDSLARE